MTAAFGPPTEPFIHLMMDPLIRLMIETGTDTVGDALATIGKTLDEYLAAEEAS